MEVRNTKAQYTIPKEGEELFKITVLLMADNIELLNAADTYFKDFDHFDIENVLAEYINRSTKLNELKDVLNAEDPNYVTFWHEILLADEAGEPIENLTKKIYESHSQQWVNSYTQYLKIDGICDYLKNELKALQALSQIRPIEHANFPKTKDYTFIPVSFFKIRVEQELKRRKEEKKQKYTPRIYDPAADPKKQYLPMYAGAALMANNISALYSSKSRTVTDPYSGETRIIANINGHEHETMTLVIPSIKPVQMALDGMETVKEPQTAAKKIALWRYKNPNGTRQQCIEETGIGKTTVYKEFNKSEKAGSILTDKILTMLQILFTKENSTADRNAPNCTVSISMEECCKLLGIENTRSSDHALRAELETLKRVTMARAVYENTKTKKYAAKVLFTDIYIDNKIIQTTYSQEYAAGLINGKGITQYPAQLLRLEKHEYWIFKKLCENYMSVSNRINGHYGIISISSLLESDRELPDLETAKANRHIDRDIVKPIDEALEALETAGLIKAPKQGLYVNSKKQPLSEGQLANYLKWSVFKDLYIAYDIPGAPDLTPAIEAKQAKKTKKKLSKNTK